jgi:DNA-binding phage protein
MPVRTTGVYIVPDDAKVVRVSGLIETVKRTKSVRQAAQEIGVSQATVSRALESEGYEVRTTTEIVRPEEGH